MEMLSNFVCEKREKEKKRSSKNLFIINKILIQVQLDNDQNVLLLTKYMPLKYDFLMEQQPWHNPSANLCCLRVNWLCNSTKNILVYRDSNSDNYL